MGRSKLRAALAAEKGVDFTKLKQKKAHKEKLKQKPVKASKGGATAALEDSEEEWED